MSSPSISPSCMTQKETVIVRNSSVGSPSFRTLLTPRVSCGHFFLAIYLPFCSTDEAHEGLQVKLDANNFELSPT